MLDVSSPAPPAPHDQRRGGSPATGRLTGVDAARGLALVGMMATHVFPEVVAGSTALSHVVFSGRASALFAVLAGVGLALSTGGVRPPGGADLAAARRGIWARAAVIAGIGLLLGAWPSGVAVILVNYGALFVVATAFLALRARTLVVLAAVWLVASPVLSQLLRPLVASPSYAVTSVADLGRPVGAAVELLLTGYYPVLTWTGYLLLGLAVGRSPLRRTGTAVTLAVVGTVVAVAAWVVSRALTARAVGQGALPRELPTLYGTTPVGISAGPAAEGSWWWLVVRTPHSGTPFDLVHTAGCALAVIGVALLVLRLRPAALLLTPLVAAGTMTLTLYTAHVLALPVLGFVLSTTVSYWLQVAVLLAFATAWQAASLHGLVPRRGPLEQVAAKASAAASGRPVVGRAT